MIYQSEDITADLAAEIVERAKAEMLCMNTLSSETSEEADEDDEL